MNNKKKNKESQVYILSEQDFYPPSDNREYKSNVFDIVNGDTYEDYTKEFYNYYKECFEDLYEDN